LAELLNRTSINDLSSSLEISKILQEAVKEGANYKLILKSRNLSVKDQFKIAGEC